MAGLILGNLKHDFTSQVASQSSSSGNEIRRLYMSCRNSVLADPKVMVGCPSMSSLLFMGLSSGSHDDVLFFQHICNASAFFLLVGCGTCCINGDIEHQKISYTGMRWLALSSLFMVFSTAAWCSSTDGQLPFRMYFIFSSLLIVLLSLSAGNLCVGSFSCPQNRLG